MRSKERSECLKKARIDRGLYVCAICSSQVRSKEIQVDHVESVVPLTGFDGFDNFIQRLWCSEDLLQAICKSCHDTKTKAEREVRKQFKPVKNAKNKL